jgi:hypothetical protein
MNGRKRWIEAIEPSARADWRFWNQVYRHSARGHWFLRILRWLATGGALAAVALLLLKSPAGTALPASPEPLAQAAVRAGCPVFSRLPVPPGQSSR